MVVLHKDMVKRILIPILLSLLFFPILILAHQPRLIESDFTLIENPEVSQAFYGELTGRPDFLQIQAEAPIKLYVGILAPVVENIGRDISVKINKDNDFYYLLDGTNFQWQAFYEEFAGDYYFKGPELSTGEKDGLPQGVEVEVGTYTLEVFSPDNQGKYVLVVGEREEFPLSEVVNMLISLPRLKEFFNKSPWQALTAPIVFPFVVLSLALIAVLILVIFFLLHNKRRQRN